MLLGSMSSPCVGSLASDVGPPVPVPAGFGGLSPVIVHQIPTPVRETLPPRARPAPTAKIIGLAGSGIEAIVISVAPSPTRPPAAVRGPWLPARITIGILANEPTVPSTP